MPTNKTRKTSCNPRKRPATQADVKKAYVQGKEVGSKGTLTLVLYTLQDKFGATDEQLHEFCDAFNYTLDSISKGYITEKDLAGVLKDEYGTTIDIK